MGGRGGHGLRVEGIYVTRRGVRVNLPLLGGDVILLSVRPIFQPPHPHIYSQSLPSGFLCFTVRY